ncbi:hypothetical protein GCM10023194_46700 [Planotetraspora phitsanulokensis]|uniref:Uncharacterized protein n=1 Tax=Planotetraspora phitsanulokensis TaxID=575192 RepID=A0A8J3U648_9ACTN|nr:hypothetical protein [Planotetraspora phitsanulokensis]GII36719.1 hypothetical protein Pph01_17220 [Planotetraspora phitsanulokensis]
MSGPFAAAIRERARSARTALERARREHDVDEMLVAEGEWDDVVRLARAHGVELGDEDAESGEETAL